MKNTLIAILYEHDQQGAEKALAKLRQCESEYFADLQDAVIVHRGEDGKVRLTQSVHLTGLSALEGAFWGSVIGFLFAGPLGFTILGVTGAGFGALAGHYTDYGIDDDFIRELSAGVKPCCSALFVLVREMQPDRLFEEFEGAGGRILKTSLPRDLEKQLAANIVSGKHRRPANRGDLL